VPKKLPCPQLVSCYGGNSILPILSKQPVTVLIMRYCVKGGNAIIGAVTDGWTRPTQDAVAADD